MSFATNDLPLLAFLGASLCTPVQVADFDVGVSLVCDTQTQVERFVSLLTGDANPPWTPLTPWNITLPPARSSTSLISEVRASRWPATVIAPLRSRAS